MKELNKLRKMQMMMYGFTSRDRISSLEIAERMGVQSMEVCLRRQRLRWFGHVFRIGEDTAVGRV